MNYKEFLHKAQFPLLITFGTLPVPMALYAAIAPELLPQIWLFPVIYIGLTLLSLVIPPKRRLLYSILATISFVAFSTLWMLRVPSLILLIVPVMHLIMLLWSLTIAPMPANEEISSFWCWLGGGIQLLMQVVLFFAWVYDYTALDVIVPWLAPVFFLFAGLVMLSMKRFSLLIAAREEDNASASMHWKNTVMTMVMFGVAVVATMVPSLVGLVKKLFSWLGSGISRLFSALPDLNGETPPAGGKKPLDGLPTEDGSSPFAELLTKLFYGLAYVAIAALAILILYSLGRWLYKLIRQLLRKVSRYVSAVSNDYQDEITDTRVTHDDDHRRTKAKLPRLSSAERNALSPRGKIRYRYLYLLFRHRDWSAHSTVRENLPPEMAALYERARYSDHPLTEEEAARFASGTRRI